MEEEFLELYAYIVESKDRKNMQILGQMTKSMMMNIIKAHPQWAREYLDVLQAVKWNNYLTRKEADQIVANMVPRPMWTTYSAWEQKIVNVGLPQQEEPFYNKEALYVTMSMICSDSCETIMNIMGLADIDNTNHDRFFKAIYRLAIDKLTDRDKVFNIRSYFKL